MHITDYSLFSDCMVYDDTAIVMLLCLKLFINDSAYIGIFALLFTKEERHCILKVRREKYFTVYIGIKVCDSFVMVSS